MSKQKPPAFQFYPKDWLEGTAAMSNAAKGAYANLLAHAWCQQPIGSLPDDEYALFKMSGADTKEEWQAYSGIVLSKFKQVEGRWYNQRLLDERVKQSEHNSKMSDRGKKGATARWTRKSNPVNNGDKKTNASGFDLEEAE